MKNRLLILVCFLITMTYVNAQTIKSYALKVGDFTELNIPDGINVIYKSCPDSAGLATYTCRADKASAIVFESKKNKLKITIDKEKGLTTNIPTVTVYSNVLHKATNSGDSTLVIYKPSPTKDVNIKVIGNGNIQAIDVKADKTSVAVEAGSGHIYISGVTTEANLRLAGVGAIEAGSLKSQDTKCWMFLNSSIDCCAEKTLSVYGASNGTIYYLGNPEIKSRCVGVHLIPVNKD